MALSAVSPSISLLVHYPRVRPSSISTTSSLLVLLSRCNHSYLTNLCFNLTATSHHSFVRASSTDGDILSTENLGAGLLNDESLRWISSAKEADQALELIIELQQDSAMGGVVATEDCNSIIEAAFDRGNPELAISVFGAMRAGSSQELSEKDSSVGRWMWGRPNVQTYALLVRGLAAVLRVSDAIKMIGYVCCSGISSGEEVPFGMIVRCPCCMIAIAVSQPQDGIQVASCSKCRYQYELVSGDIVSIDSEEISMDISALEKALRFLRIMKEGIPAAVHSVVIRTPGGAARTYTVATKTVDLPAQEGERVTISLAAPSNVYREMGPFRLSAKSPGFNPGEPMCLVNHCSRQVLQLLRAPFKDGYSFLRNPSFIFPSLVLLATGDAASGIIDPVLPRLISIAVISSVALGTTVDRLVIPQLSKLPQRTVDVVALKQQLLSQYDLLQTRINGLRQAAENEVWMLARMYQLERKIIAVGEPSYRARRVRVKRVREGLESSLSARIELIDSYARISSMIEIEVEMDSDVLAAEAVSNAERIAEQIQQIMEIEDLEEGWRIQAQANDEVERLLSSPPLSTEHVKWDLDA